MALILASKSPRRQELLAQMGLTDFEIHPAVGEELAEPGLTPPELVQALALHKAREVAEKFAQPGDPNHRCGHHRGAGRPGIGQAP